MPTPGHALQPSPGSTVLPSPFPPPRRIRMAHLICHRGREEHRLAVLGTHADDLLHLLLKVLVQHPGEQGRQGIRGHGLSSLLSQRRAENTRQAIFSCCHWLCFRLIYVLTLLALIFVILPCLQDSLRIIIWPHVLIFN